MKKLLFLGLFPFLTFGQNNPNPGYWQQHVEYKMEVKMDVKKFQYTGKQEIIYTNNSNDTLHKVYYHLYNNAFQPGSEMDARLQAISDPDKRMVRTFKKEGKDIKESRISTLKPNEIGYLNIANFKQDGVTATTKVVGTILEVTLAKAILPKQKTVLSLDFDGQVPLQIRRSGRISEEGVALSMTQWYPKLCEYDFEGWHSNPYIAREFHGVWGNFDVKITIDKNYTIGGTGYLQNKNEIGHGYQDTGIKVVHAKKTKNLTWHFYAPNVHDFAWGADNEFIHDMILGPNNVELHFLYKNKKENLENWKKMQPKTAELLAYFNENVGQYPYKQYSVIQGGDGGMEYGMCTLITGNRAFGSLVGVTAHEMAHSWFQFVLATNETKHEWMDEGFTSYISNLAMNKILPPKKPETPFESAYKNYIYLAKSGKEQPLSTHADRYDVNMAYGISAYSKGEVFLVQLGYLIGQENLNKTIKRYYNEYKFTHPTPNDIKRVAEKVSGANLDWYLLDWTLTTNTIDYSIKEVSEANAANTKVVFERKGRMPMPLDVIVEYSDGTKEFFYIPNTLMRWEKPNPYPEIKGKVLTGWDWAYPTFTFEIAKPKALIKSITIDPENIMADINKEDNIFVKK
ncbi:MULTISPECIES: M1 family metallopeptidase [unclassified Flavobacterium]|uniref:M1 family metallopeptidase n=1 Tax=unclassified Flavobacterium TaxID=196869 RepID=UPI001290AEA0|nr:MULTISPECIES: M1 family metallopeptidase [unclassified Flavobacterium]MQP51592.1 M1 family peptidase [Flavobacterium sp. LMO9]MQP61180.1 M1 family peptidase [Flavobacterium sp. LMO6]